MTAMQKIAEARNAEALLALLRDTMARLDQYHAALHKVLDPMLTRSAEVAASTQEDWRPLKTCDAGGYSRETLRAWCTKVWSERKDRRAMARRSGRPGHAPPQVTKIAAVPQSKKSNTAGPETTMASTPPSSPREIATCAPPSPGERLICQRPRLSSPTGVSG